MANEIDTAYIIGDYESQKDKVYAELKPVVLDSQMTHAHNEWTGSQAQFPYDQSEWPMLNVSSVFDQHTGPQFQTETDFTASPYQSKLCNDFDDELNFTQIENGNVKSATTVEAANVNEYDTDSQPICNQEFFKLIDQALEGEPRDLYIESLIEKSNNCEETIAMYRSILVKRARLSDKCPNGPMFTRRTTKHESASKRYASDCYAIQTFIENDDPKILTDIFARRRMSVKSEPQDTCINVEPMIGINSIRLEIAQLKAQVLELKSIVNTLKTEQNQDKSKILTLETSVSGLKLELSKVESTTNKNSKTEKTISVENPKIESLFENIKQKAKYQSTANNTSENMTNQTTTTKRDVNKDQNSPKVTTESNVLAECNKERTLPQAPKRSSYSETIQGSTDVSRKSSSENYAAICKKDKKTSDADNSTEPSNINNGNVESQKKSMQFGKRNLRLCYTSDGQPRFTRSNTPLDINMPGNQGETSNIKVHITERNNHETYKASTCNTKNQPRQFKNQAQNDHYNAPFKAKYDEQPVFESVNRRRTIRYYIGGISKDSNRAGLIDFLEYYGIKPAGVRMIETRRNSLSAKLTINSSDRHVIESEIWPKGMYCRRWQGQQKWNERFENPNSAYQNYVHSDDVD